MTGQVVTVPLGRRAYDIHIGAGILAAPGDAVPGHLRGRAAFIITDAHVAPHWLAPLKAGWWGTAHELVLPPGEATKTPDTLMFVLSWLLAAGAGRDSVVIALGGGVVGDVAGLAAALLARGTPYIQIPTTLMAQADSAVGGKTAVNMPQGKNMIGAIHQPSAVICDTDTLGTLSTREIRAGYAEIVKYGAIRDEGFFAWLESNGEKVIAGDKAAVIHAIAASCRHKAEIVAKDEEDADVRMLLNFGHTFAHGIEAFGGYDGTVLHGEAVAAGMVMASRLSRSLGFCAEGDVARLAAHIAACGLPTGLRGLVPEGAVDEILVAMRRDKKAAAGRPVFILTRGIGKAFISRDAAMTDAEDIIRESICLVT